MEVLNLANGEIGVEGCVVEALSKAQKPVRTAEITGTESDGVVAGQELAADSKSAVGESDTESVRSAKPAARNLSHGMGASHGDERRLVRPKGDVDATLAGT
jgi:hypothetical protein